MKAFFLSVFAVLAIAGGFALPAAAQAVQASASSAQITSSGHNTQQGLRELW